LTDFFCIFVIITTTAWTDWRWT